MDEITQTKALMAQISRTEASSFEYDEAAILNEYSAESENNSNLAIKILSIFGGILATFFFLGFLAILGLSNSEFALLIFGFAFVYGAILLNKVFDKLIVNTFSVSLYLSGYVLIAIGLSELNIDEDIVAIGLILIALSALKLTRNYFLIFISAIGISVCFIFLIFENEAYDFMHLYIAFYSLATAYFMLNEAKLLAYSNHSNKLYYPIRISLIFSLILGLIAIAHKIFLPSSEIHIWIPSIILGCVVLYVIHSILKTTEINNTKTKTLIFIASSFILLASSLAPAIIGALLIILLSFKVNYKTGFVIGIIALIYFISLYYYDLNFTLLTKSIMLFSSGVLFIICYLFTAKKINSNEKI